MKPVENFRAESAEECVKVEVGDYVVSFDWEHRDDCYAEGVVEAIENPWGDCDRYKIRAHYSTVAGDKREVCREQSTVYPPANGVRHSFGGFCNGVRVKHTKDEWRAILQDHAEDLAGDHYG